jgi:hypothetical protein
MQATYLYDYGPMPQQIIDVEQGQQTVIRAPPRKHFTSAVGSTAVTPKPLLPGLPGSPLQPPFALLSLLPGLPRTP